MDWQTAGQSDPYVSPFLQKGDTKIKKTQFSRQNIYSNLHVLGTFRNYMHTQTEVCKSITSKIECIECSLCNK